MYNDRVGIQEVLHTLGVLGELILVLLVPKVCTLGKLSPFLFT